MRPTKGILLMVDNNPDFLDGRSEILEYYGYTVFKAVDLAQAQHTIENEYVHLAIVDLRMTNDDDERDESGLAFAQNPRYRAVPKVILTGFPSVDSVRKALRMQDDGSPVVLDFLSKTDNHIEMIEAIDAIIAEQIGINWGLKIRWMKDSPRSFYNMANLFTSQVTPENLVRRGDELADLLRKLFREFEQVTLSRLLWYNQGHLALPVYAYRQNERREYLVLLGTRDSMRTMQKNTQEAIEKTLGASDIGRELGAETLHFVAEAWAFRHASLEQCKPFPDFFRAAGEKQIRDSLGQLIQTTLAPWMNLDPGVEGAPNLADVYRARLGISQAQFPVRELSRVLEDIAEDPFSQALVKVRFQNGRMKFVFVSEAPIEPLDLEDCPDPAGLLETSNWFLHTPYSLRYAFERLDLDSILVDGAEHAWLTDYSALVKAPDYYTFLRLENQIRFELMGTGSLRRRYDFEKRLLDSGSLAESIPVKEFDLDCRNAFVAIQAIRQHAAQTFGDNLLAYHTGLFFLTLGGFQAYDGSLRLTGLEMLTYLHRLILAGLLGKRIDAMQKTPGAPLPASLRGKLVIDPATKEVSIGQRKVHLTPKEYELLEYLYRRAGVVCPRKEIVQNVWGIDKPSKDDENSLLNSHLNRLRKGIEPESQKQLYIRTIRGQGILLTLEPD